jgi:hypothetical protein
MTTEHHAPVKKWGLVQYVTPGFRAYGPWRSVLERNLLRSAKRGGYKPVEGVTISEWPLELGEEPTPEMEHGADRYITSVHVVPLDVPLPSEPMP